MIRNPWRNRYWLRAYEVSATHPWVGAIAGLGLVAMLVPILTFAGGYTGSLGPSIPLFFLVPMLVASTLGGRIAGVIVSVAAVAVWDWFFIPPLYTPTVYYPRDLLGLVVFLFDALLTGQLSTVARQRAEDAIRRASTSEALYDLSMTLIGSHDLNSVLPALTERLRATFDLRACAILLDDSQGSSWRTIAASGIIPDDLNIERSRNIAGILSWIRTTGQMCGIGGGLGPTGANGHIGSKNNPERQAQFWPLLVGPRLVGVLELIYGPGTELDPERDRLLTTLVNGAAIALEQERLSHEEQEAMFARESDRLKSALLSSVSHDLRTPLAGIKAAASSLLQDDVEWDEVNRRAFIVDIDAEADRLTRLVSNLLDLSRIEAGAIRPNKEWEDVSELIDRVVQRLQPQLPTHTIDLSVAPGLPPARLDGVHIEQVLTNLIENAAKYSSRGTPITIEARVISSHGSDPALHLSVIDRGPGISVTEQEKVFDKFYRIATSGKRTGGTGMGLAIVKGLVEADGGSVGVKSELGHGSMFTVVLPVGEGDGADEGYSEGADQSTLELPSL
jgi:two-component system, OmpR family, sensor histidine kinase KdpD